MATVYSLVCWGGLIGKTVSISASTDLVTLTNHGLRNGTKLWPSGTLPSELNTSTPVYARSTAANTFTLHTSAAGAIANTGQVTFAGSSTYAAVVLKSDIVASPSTALSAYGLSDLSRWWISGSNYRIYDGLASWVSGRSGASNLDTEFCEIGEAFSEWSAGTLSLSVPAASTSIASTVNGYVSPAHHMGVVGDGFVFKRPTNSSGSALSIAKPRTQIDGITVNVVTGAGYGTDGIAWTSAIYLSTVKNCFIIRTDGLSYGYGAYLFGALASMYNCVLYGWNAGVYVPNYTVGMFVGSCTSVKNNYGFYSNATPVYGNFINNIAVGNATANWSGSTATLESASNNAGLSGEAWITGSNPRFTLATTDFADYTNNNFKAASSSSPQVENGATYYGIASVDIGLAEAPNYMNGAAESFDIGPYEFDHGYGPHPVTTPRGLAFTGLIAGSEVKVFDTGTQTTVFTDTSSATSETWSENASGSKTVDYTILKDGYVPIRVTGITVTGAASGGVLSTPIQQVLDRAYITPSGLSIGSTATYNTGTKRFAVTTATTVQNWYSYMVQCWRTESALANVAFPVSSNGPNSFQLSGDWQFSSGINYLSRDGLRYLNSSGAVTDSWAAILSVGVPAGMTVRYEQTDGGTATSAAATGNIDQLVKIYESGAFDYTGFLVLKVQGAGYDQAEFDAYATYGTLEDQLYVVGLTPTANGIASGSVTGVTITDHGASPVTWNSKAFSITITDTTGHTGEQIVQYVRGLNNFNYHDLVQTNGTEFKTVRGKLYGDTGAVLKGVMVVQADGTTSHADFNLHTADDGTTYIPPLPPAAVTATVLADTRVQLFNVTTNTEIDNDFLIGTSYNFVITTEASAGDTLRLRACKMGRESAEAFGIWSGNPLPLLISQPENEIYTAWGIDGSTCTEFSGDVAGHIYIDANDLDGVSQKVRLGAWYSWVLTLDIGIRHFYGAMSYVAVNALRINVDVTDILIENVNASMSLRFTDLDVRLYRSDGTSVIAPTSYSIHNDYSGVPDVVETGVSGLTTAESNQLFSIPTTSGGSGSADDVWAHQKALTVGKFLGLK